MVWRPQQIQEKSKIKFTIDDVRKINNYISVDFGPRVCKNSVGVNVYVGTRRTNTTLSKPKYVIGNTKYNMDYYIKSYCCKENLEFTRTKLELSVFEAVNSIRKYNHNDVEFLWVK